MKNNLTIKNDKGNLVEYSTVLAVLERENFKLELVYKSNNEFGYFISYRYGSDWNVCKLSDYEFNDTQYDNLKITMNQILDLELTKKLKEFKIVFNQFIYTKDKFMMFPKGTDVNIVNGFLLNNISSLNGGRLEF